MKPAVRNRLFLVVAAVAAAAIGVYFSQVNRTFTSNATVINDDDALKTAFNLKRERIDGAPASIHELRGRKLTVVNLWATWCTPCREEMPEFIALQKEQGQAAGVQFIGIAIDRIEPVRKFMAEIGVNYPILFGDIGMIDLTKTHGNDKQALPFSYVLDASGKVVHAKLGKLSRDEILLISSKMH